MLWQVTVASTGIFLGDSRGTRVIDYDETIIDVDTYLWQRHLKR